MRLYTLSLMLLLSLALGGCFGSETDAGADPMHAGLSYYYAEFPDVAIPNEMKPDQSDTFITYTGDGIKLGTQVYKGRVEIASLATAMQGHMQRDGWSLRSIFRAPRGGILIFEKQQRMCSIYLFEDIINTGMLVFVSPKLSDGALQYSVPASTATEPLAPSDPVIGSSAPPSAPVSAAQHTGSSASIDNGNITVYPAQ